MLHVKLDSCVVSARVVYVRSDKLVQSCVMLERLCLPMRMLIGSLNVITADALVSLRVREERPLLLPKTQLVDPHVARPCVHPCPRKAYTQDPNLLRQT
jgi:hypothetical protein